MNTSWTATSTIVFVMRSFSQDKYLVRCPALFKVSQFVRREVAELYLQRHIFVCPYRADTTAETLAERDPELAEGLRKALGPCVSHLRNNVVLGDRCKVVRILDFHTDSPTGYRRTTHSPLDSHHIDQIPSLQVQAAQIYVSYARLIWHHDSPPTFEFPGRGFCGLDTKEAIICNVEGRRMNNLESVY